MSDKIIEECYIRSLELLFANSSEFGFLASSPSERATERNYLSIFGRDASICAIAASLTGYKKLLITARRSLITLAKFQAPNGQIPNYVKPEINTSDFWYLGCIDATLWWLIALKLLAKNDKQNLENKLSKNIVRAINWLNCQEHPKSFLLQQNEASDWADIMPRSGFVLYTNALWYWVKKLYYIKTAEQTRTSANYLFYPWKNIPPAYFKSNHRAKRMIDFAQTQPKSDFYLSFINYASIGEEIDVFGNLLAIISGLANQKDSKRIINCLIKYGSNRPFPIKTVLNPIVENSSRWREYMKTHNQNFPNQYHNGGIWPFIGGFWIVVLILAGKKKEAFKDLDYLAAANQLNGWQFNEWLHGQTGEPFGMPGQSWNAAAFVIALKTLSQKHGFKLYE